MKTLYLLSFTFFLAWISPAAEISAERLRAFAPLPAVMESKTNPITDAKVELGRMLYYEPRLSKSHQLSCNSCHGLTTYGVDNEPTSPGHKGKRGDRNSPTVYNAGGHIAQFWDGRAADLEEQAKGPVLNPVEMAMPSKDYVLKVLHSIPEYGELFRKAFPGEAQPITYDNMARAIGAFERKLVTPSRWDQFLKGDKAALSEAEKAGFNKFVEVGCASCHAGAYVGGNMFSKLGVAKPYPEQKDLGRYAVTKKESDKMVFKVPSLRNIEKTGPYFHDGRVKTLEEAVELMAEYELGKKLSSADTQAIVTWLKTLTGELPKDYIRQPQLPPSGKSTPKPDLSD
jgi:cytochrome c peroxidase